MSDQLERIAAIESDAIVTEAQGEFGKVVYRSWQPWGDQMGGELVVLLHGGSGSWTHWIKNISKLSDYYELLIPDLPALGDSDRVPSGTEPSGIANHFAGTLQNMVGPRRFHLVAFSWGCVVAALSAPKLASQVKSIFLVGPASTGKPPGRTEMKPLIARAAHMSEEQVSEANKENLARLMIHDRQKIDPLAVTIQNSNTSRARYNSPKFAMTEVLLDGLKQTTANLLVVYGAEDTVTIPHMAWREAQIKSARPDATFETVPGVGHWVQYEAPDWFNQRAVDWIEQNIFA